MAAVTSILRSTRRLVSSGICLVASRNGTSAIFGPIPIKSSRNVSITNATLSVSSSIRGSCSVAGRVVIVERHVYPRPAAGLVPSSLHWAKTMGIT